MFPSVIASPTPDSVKPRLVIEVWLRRGDTLRRLYGAKAGDAEISHPGLIRLVLQPYEGGAVIAWRPVWERWVSLVQAQRALDALLAEGWEVARPPACEDGRPRSLPSLEERRAHRRAWDRARKARAKAGRERRDLSAA